MNKTESPHVASGEAYARDVIAGDIPACKWVRLACQRHFRDKDRKNWDYKFDPVKVERVAKFVELFPHTKGKWAAHNERFVLQPWQCFMVLSIFGWIHKSGPKKGKRRFTRAMLLVPRKNGKSDFAARLGLYMLAADEEFGAECYSGATSEVQAWEVFRPARLMAERTPAFQEHYGVGIMKSNLHILVNGSRFEPIIGKPGDGASPSCAIIDEYHEHLDDTLFDTMETGMAAREQPLSLVITTAGDNLGGPCYSLLKDLEKILEGTTENETFWGIVYSIDTEPQLVRYDLCNSLIQMVKYCTCQKESVDRHSKIRSAKITRIDRLATQAYALRATTDSLESESLSTRNERRPKGENGALRTARESWKVSGDGSNAIKINAKHMDLPIALSDTESLLKNTDNWLNGKTDSAEYVELQSQLLSLIMIIHQGKSAASSASVAIAESVCSEILKKEYDAHSNTCETRQRLKINDSTLEETLPADAWDTEEALIKANPNYGISVDVDRLRIKQREAIRNSRKQGVFQTKHLNVWVGARQAFFNIHAWHSCAKPEIKPEHFKGNRLFIGLDLASTKDIAAAVLLFELENGNFATFGRFYIPEASIENGANEHYAGWARDGRLIVTEGNMIDYRQIEADILELHGRFGVSELAFDPAYAQMLVQRLGEQGISCTEVRPTVMNFSGPMKHIDGLILSGKIHHDGDPCFTWQLSNVVSKTDQKDNVYPNKERGEAKIDAAVALIMSMNRAMVETPQPSYSVFFV